MCVCVCVCVGGGGAMHGPEVKMGVLASVGGSCAGRPGRARGRGRSDSGNPGPISMITADQRGRCFEVRGQRGFQAGSGQPGPGLSGAWPVLQVGAAWITV